MKSHSERVGSHSERLGSHSERVGSHSERLGSHSERLGSHSERVGSHSERVGSHSKRAKITLKVWKVTLKEWGVTLKEWEVTLMWVNIHKAYCLLFVKKLTSKRVVWGTNPKTVKIPFQKEWIFTGGKKSEHSLMGVKIISTLSEWLIMYVFACMIHVCMM